MARPAWLPLLWGEGWGEGERGRRTDAAAQYVFGPRATEPQFLAALGLPVGPSEGERGCSVLPIPRSCQYSQYNTPVSGLRRPGLVLLVETYVDPQRFEGACYRAAKWIEIGLTKGLGRSRLDFYQLHPQPKALFLYPLVPNASEILSAPLLPPAWAPYRREPPPPHYPLSGQQTRSLLETLAPLRDPRR